MPPSSSTPLHIGILLLETTQLLDLSAIDLLYMTTPEYLTTCTPPLPQSLISMSRPCKMHYITANAANPTHTTSQLSIQPTSSLTSPAVAPGTLDLVLIPGPSPKTMPPANEYLDFVRAHFEAGVLVLAVCTAAFVVGYAGVVDGRRVTAPRLLVPEMRRMFPGAEWDERVRVVRDGNLWTCGGITNGHDLVIAYLRDHYPALLVNTILAAADITPRPVAYATSATEDTDTVYAVWRVIKAFSKAVVWFFGKK
ncbi:hypothetical protein DTO006G1_6177 [Penicillium roqueforti]|nr:hypothetical protein DTO006G1_6177 [Penicillium roqueforti]KAI3095959.1 hypothetical protein CBS147333_9686 [Penicillium roqueforti]KAI3192532.1 hypothetical protein CBS147311_9097 [Penicillium roqueforti]KAI3252251.1 hypothetical protein DTO006G7_6909 [Penicillium roqueforti]KAI3262191.1 hypothetical protein CBS147308_9432 [Penicillium roqueforti]